MRASGPAHRTPAPACTRVSPHPLYSVLERTRPRLRKVDCLVPGPGAPNQHSTRSGAALVRRFLTLPICQHWLGPLAPQRPLEPGHPGRISPVVMEPPPPKKVASVMTGEALPDAVRPPGPYNSRQTTCSSGPHGRSQFPVASPIPQTHSGPQGFSGTPQPSVASSPAGAQPGRTRPSGPGATAGVRKGGDGMRVCAPDPLPSGAWARAPSGPSLAQAPFLAGWDREWTSRPLSAYDARLTEKHGDFNGHRRAQPWGRGELLCARGWWRRRQREARHPGPCCQPFKTGPAPPRGLVLVLKPAMLHRQKRRHCMWEGSRGPTAPEREVRSASRCKGLQFWAGPGPRS